MEVLVEHDVHIAREAEIAAVRTRIASETASARSLALVAFGLIALLFVLFPDDMPAWGRMVFFALSMALLSAFAVNATEWVDAGERRVSFKRAVGNRASGVRLAISGRPFALYLRSFADERTRYRLGPAGSLIENPTGEAELPLLQPVAEMLPILTLSNSRDSFSESPALRMAVPDSVWFDHVRGLGLRAAAIIVHVGMFPADNNALTKELAWLSSERLLAKTVVLGEAGYLNKLSAEVQEGLRDCIAVLEKPPFEVELYGTRNRVAVRLPDRVLERIDGLSKSYNVAPLRVRCRGFETAQAALAELGSHIATFTMADGDTGHTLRLTPRSDKVR